VKTKTEIIFFAAIIVLALAPVAAMAEPTATNYYLPKGYKVHATIYVPCAPFLPGEMLGGSVGISTGNYMVYVQAYGWKNPWNWAEYKSGVRVVWVENGQKTTKADVQVEGCDYDLDVVITYNWDGRITLAAAKQKGGTPASLYSFVATADKYSIVSEGAVVDAPEALPQPTTTSGADTGSGYNPPTIKDIKQQWLLYGMLGGGAFAIILLMLMSKNKSYKTG